MSNEGVTLLTELNRLLQVFQNRMLRFLDNDKDESLIKPCLSFFDIDSFERIKALTYLISSILLLTTDATFLRRFKDFCSEAIDLSLYLDEKSESFSAVTVPHVVAKYS